MSWEETVKRLSDGTRRIVVQLLDAVERGDLTPSDFDVLALDVLTTANRQGYDLGHVKVRAYIESVTGTPSAVPPGSPPPSGADRLSKALATIKSSGLDSAMQLDRLAREEPVEAANRGTADAMSRSPEVTGWTRGLESDACELCIWWWRGGRVFKQEWTMPRHIGCVCDPVPHVGRTDNYQTERQAKAGQRRNQAGNR